MKEIKKIVLIISYLALAIPMFYYTNKDIVLGGFGFMYKYLFGLGIVALALFVFLVSPDFKRGSLSVRYTGIIAAPYLWILLYSLFLWAFTMSAFRVITRGLFYIVYQLIAVMAAAAVLYLFGEQGIYWQLLALFAADGIYIVQAIQENGLGKFAREYIDLVITFTETTGPTMKNFELLGHSYALGFFLVFFFFNMKENKRKIVWAMIAVLLFFLGLKRSVFMAVAAAIFVGLILGRMKKPRTWFMALSYLGIVFGMLYVFGVSIGLFDWMEHAGISTNGRDWLFQQFHDYYDMGLGFWGRGAGFVVGSILNGTIDLTMDGYQFGDIHNDFLRQYIEVGFVGFIIWLLIFMRYRIGRFFHKNKEKNEIRHGVLTGVFILITFVTFMTENSFYHYYTTLFMATMIMGYKYETFAEQIKLPGE